MAIRISGISFLVFFLFSLVTSSAAQAQLVARQITLETAGTDLFLGSDPQGGVGDWYLSNGSVQAIIDNVGLQEDILAATGGVVALPITNGTAPSGGTLIDLGLVGRNNDQLDQIFQLVNFSALNPIVYVPASQALGNPSLPPILASVTSSQASLTVFGFVLMPPISLPGSPALLAVTEYSLRTGENFLRIRTTVTNNSGAPLLLFSIVDAMVLGGRSNLPFAVFPGRGFDHPPLDLTDPLPAVGIYPYVSATGRLGPSDGIADTVAMVPAEEVSYTVLTPPGLLFGVNSDLVSATGNFPDFTPLGIGQSRVYERRVIVGERNDVAASADFALAQLSPLFGFPLGGVEGTLVAPDGLPFRASLDIIQIDLNPLTAEPETLLSAILGDTSPLPLSHVITESSRDGKFEAVLPAGLYHVTITTEERGDIGPIPFVVQPGSTTDLGEIFLSAPGRLLVNVVPPGPAKITFKGASGSPDPNFGVPVEVTVGGATVAGRADVSSPALNVIYTATGQVETIIRPGSYRLLASRGLEYTVDSQSVVVGPGQTLEVKLAIQRAIETEGFLSADFHVHTARSLDSSIPPRDRILSFTASGVEVLVSTDHDFIFDYQPVIEELGLAGEITSMVGDEVTTGLFPTNFGHFNGWPLPVQPQARRDGAPEDEFVEPNVIFDRLRALGAEVVQVNHPESPLFGFFNFFGYNSNQSITAPPNTFLLNQAITGSGTRNVDFDALEIYNGRSIPEYVLSRQDWFSLLNQGILKVATAVSDSHRVVAAEAGFPRSFVESRTRNLGEFDPNEFNANLKSMRAIGTSGPVLNVQVLGAGRGFPAGDRAQGPSDIGRLIQVGRGGIAHLLIKVQAAPWIPVEEIRVFVNGQLVRRVPVVPSTFSLRFFGTIALAQLTQDAYVVVEAGQVLPEDPTVQPPSLGLLGVVEPGVVSLAFTNPIFLDVDGNGQFDPPGVPPPALDTARLRHVIRSRTPVEEHWEGFWPQFQITPEQAENAAERLTGRGRR